MKALRQWSMLFALALVSPAPVVAQRQADLDAINQLIDRYGSTEDAMDMTAQAQLMVADRIWIGQGAGRRTDQAANMRIQQAGMDQLRKTVPGMQTFTEDRDRLIRFYGNASVAVASFYRYTTRILPAGVSREVADGLPALLPAVVTMVLEKRDQGWKIVHTHFSSLGPAS